MKTDSDSEEAEFGSHRNSESLGEVLGVFHVTNERRNESVTDESLQQIVSSVQVNLQSDQVARLT